MNNFNKSWLALIIFGVVFLIFTIIWDILQITSLGAEEFSYSVNQMPRSILLSPTVKEHLQSDTGFDRFLSSQQESESL